MKNIITVNLILNEIGLKKFKVVPTFKNLLHQNQVDKLVAGENKLNVSHTTWGDLQRVVSYDFLNMRVEKINT